MGVALMYVRAVKVIMGLEIAAAGVKKNVIDGFWFLTHPDRKRLARKGLFSAIYIEKS